MQGLKSWKQKSISLKKVLNPLNGAEEQSSASSKHIYFFDLDHTLIKANSSAAFGKFLFRKKIISFPRALFLVLVYRLHRWRMVSLTKLHLLSFKFIFKDIEKRFFSELLQEQLQADFDRIQSSRMSEVYKEARSKGELYILSSSPDFIVEAYAKKFAVDGFYATEYCTDERGVFSHVGVVVDGEKKWEYAKEKIKGLTSFAYSDDSVDAPLLNGVANGFLIEPER